MYGPVLSRLREGWVDAVCDQQWLERPIEEPQVRVSECHALDIMGTPRDLVGLVDRVSGPAYAVGAGLVSWGLMADERRPLPRGGSLAGRRFLNWLKALLPG